MKDLFEKLRENRDSEIYPYHMPGHKRQPCGGLSRELGGLDITETDGFDNLHQPQNVLLELQRKAAQIYGAEESFYLVNGSTSGVLSALSAALPTGGHILMSRNCHKSAYHGAYLRNLKISYLYPHVIPFFDLCDSVDPKEVQKALEADSGIGAVLLVSPTYEGRISDIPAIAEIVHEKGIPLIVDEAHGAHLGFGGVSPENSCLAGADLVIHSVHKTLPALTQTALLHVNGDRINRERLRRFLRIYQSSSPSYLLMASIDNALQFVEHQGERAFEEFAVRYEGMMKRLEICQCLQILPWDKNVQDIGKLVISVKNAGISGRELHDILLHRYHLQVEMAAESYVLAMFTANDSSEGYDRMTSALLEIDSELTVRGQRERMESAETFAVSYGAFTLEPPVCMVPFARAWDMETEEIPLKESAGRCAGEFVNLYPPGVPVLVPGEQITELLCKKVEVWRRTGLTVQGIRIQDDKIYVKVLV